MTKNTKVKKETDEIVCLNEQTVGNMKKYLNRFPDDARIIIHARLNAGEYRNFDCCIGCNFDYQQENNMVFLYPGLFVD